MLELKNVNKYFFRHKSNEIHVINNTSLSFEEKGIVALLGPSGCGKTTLLNVIGGLDKVNSGQVYVNGQKITGRRAGKVDQIRNLNIGYIFQDYNLIDNMTVYDNVAMVLRMVGIKDKDEIREKVEYVLDLVGMYRYRRRFADMLSGGERQRVGIARALVKNPAIIIADEPTGNLDSANTLEVMNIIKTISKEKLVVLVTHEEDLANFYADRIIRLKDGSVVSDEMNDNAGDLDYRIENRIYLKDLEDHRTYGDQDNHIEFYNDGSAGMDIDIVIQNGNLFIRNRDELGRTEVVDHNSAMEMVDDHYRTMSREESEEHALDTEKLKASKPLKHSSILNPFSMMKAGFKSVGEYHILKKILLLGFFLSAVFITYSVANINGILDIKDKAFIQDDHAYLRIMDKNVKVKEYLSYEKEEQVNYLLPGSGNVNFNFPFDKYIQTNYGSATLSGSLSSIDKISESDLTNGRMPTKPYEIVIDEMTVSRMRQMSDATNAGYANGKDMLERTVTIPNMKKFKIVGVVDKSSPCIYVDPSLFIDIIANNTTGEVYMEDEPSSDTGPAVLNVNLMKKDVKLRANTNSRWPQSDYEVVVSHLHSEEWAIGKEIPTKINGHKLKVVGYYEDTQQRDYLLVTPRTMKYKVILDNDNVTVDPVDKAEAKAALEARGLKVRDLYAHNRSQYRQQIMSVIRGQLIVGGIVILISLIEIYLIVRASFLSRIKEVGILRAIGVKKRDIYRMFKGEILAVTLLASMPGFLFGSFLVYRLQQISFTEDMYLYDWKAVVASLAIIFGFNLFFGLLPVMRTMVKRPAAILARTDVN